MEKYDLCKITRENLLFLLSTAKDEIAKYARCREKIERSKENIAKRKPKNWVIFIFLVMGITIIFKGSRDMGQFSLTSFFLFIVVPVAILIYTQIKYQKEIKEHEAQVFALQKKAEEAVSEFKAALFIPEDYCYKYAVATMLQYIVNKRADSWKEVTGLYEEHVHRMTMEEQSKFQTEIARKNLSATQTAAAGAWASAAGIWFRR